jgi:murein DD-endopeptidase MepM/ murein hydrolase activator NlpD
MSTFPLPFRPALPYNTGGRRFGADRDNGRKHAACDMIVPLGTAIYAVADGTVVQPAYDFYRGTKAIEVDHGGFLVRYCEIKSAILGLTTGVAVKEGDVIAYVGKMYVDSMLHFEMYSKEGGATGGLTVRANLPFQRRSDLVDPTSFLDAAALRSPAPVPATP